ncbi:chemotaxis protein CheW [Desulfuromonas carbonis]|uniref:chemotaxis protein CheW n=1 Tax=Desulfuromonas sp. DDH964 TaxID=1823759 RepID=UPI00078D4C1A|nr:chemotaxis protein CheW [Desulfuromonas sp. DDH964]AMV73862.1 scaffold protein CheW associated with MCPs of class 34H [Desulfuromonas sp. DDH964]
MDLTLTFRLGEELYGLEVADVQEIVEAPDFDYIPLAPAGYLGAINFHGTILPVLDLAGYLGLEASQRDRRVIVLPAATCPLGLGVTAVGRILALEREKMLPYLQDREREAYIREVFNHQGDMINMLDLARLLASLETH